MMSFGCAPLQWNARCTIKKKWSFRVQTPGDAGTAKKRKKKMVGKPLLSDQSRKKKKKKIDVERENGKSQILPLSLLSQ